MRTMKTKFLVLHLAVVFTFNQFTECLPSNIEDIQSGLALFTAATNGDITAVRAELAKGTNPDWRWTQGNIFGDDDSSGLGEIFSLAAKLTPLMAAVQSGHADIVDLLINKNANINFRSLDGLSPIMFAVGWNQPDMVKLLLRRGANPKQKDDNGMTVVDHARALGHSYLVCIIENFNKEEWCDQHENTIDTAVDSSVTTISPSSFLFPGQALLNAAIDGDISVVRAELAKGIDPDWHMELYTPLIAAVQHGHADIVELLINKNADVNFRGPVGASPIITAAGFNQPDIAELLLRSGADPKQKDNNGRTALDYARVKGHYKLVSILENATSGVALPVKLGGISSTLFISVQILIFILSVVYI